MLARVDKVIIRGPLQSARSPVYFYDGRRAVMRGMRLAAFQASPGVGAVLRGARI